MNKKLRKNFLWGTNKLVVFFKVWDKLFIQCFLMGYRRNVIYHLYFLCIHTRIKARVIRKIQVMRGIFHGIPPKTITTICSFTILNQV